MRFRGLRSINGTDLRADRRGYKEVFFEPATFLGTETKKCSAKGRNTLKKVSFKSQGIIGQSPDHSRSVDPHRIPLWDLVDIVAACFVDVFADQHVPAGSLVKVEPALAVRVVVELDLVRKRHLEKINEHNERIHIHRAVHEQHSVIVKINAERIALDYLHISVSRRPAFGNGCNLRVEFDARDIALEAFAHKVCEDSALAAADVDKGIALIELEVFEDDVESQVRSGLAAGRAVRARKRSRNEHAELPAAYFLVPAVIKAASDSIG